MATSLDEDSDETMESDVDESTADGEIHAEGSYDIESKNGQISKENTNVRRSTRARRPNVRHANYKSSTIGSDDDDEFNDR